MTKTVDCLDWFCGAGGMTAGAKRAGARFIHAANHADLPVATYALNHPDVDDLRQADLLEVDPADAPRAMVAFMSPSCVAHSRAASEREYLEGPNLFNGGHAQRAAGGSVGKQERTRQTMVAPLRYARIHRPEFVVCENVVETVQWGYARAGAPKMGDGAHYRWWRGEWDKLGYDVTELYLNSAAFGVAQSRDRWYFVARRRDVPAPDLEFRPECWCPSCERVVEGVQSWKPRKKTWPAAQWGKLGTQYVYRCGGTADQAPCGKVAELIAPPAWTCIDWSDVGQRIGDRLDEFAPRTLARMRRGFEMFKDQPAWMAPYGATHGSPRGADQPAATVTSSRDRQVVFNSGFTYTHSGNTFEHDGQTRARSMWRPRPTVTSDNTEGVVMLPPATWTKVNGSEIDATAWHDFGDPVGTITSKDTTMLMMSPNVPAWVSYYYGQVRPGSHVSEPAGTVMSENKHALMTAPNPVAFEDCTQRMMRPRTELVKFMGFPDDYVWPTENQGDVTRLLGQAVTPPLIDQLADRVFGVLAS